MNSEVAIIGAGLGGVCLGINLLKAGLSDFKIFEKSDSVSGIWNENSYPGCACDVAAHVYQYSFELNPNWSRVFPPRNEIKKYVEDTVEKYAVRKHIVFNHEILHVEYDNELGKWHLTDHTGQTITAKYVVLAVGTLTKPNIPKFKNQDKYQGPIFHTARWNHSVDLRGKRVGIIGSGSSAIQAIPHLAKAAGKLVVFQRSPNYVLPIADRDYTEQERSRFRKYPWLMRLHRWKLFWHHEKLFFADRGSIVERTEKEFLRHLSNEVKDEALRAKLTPDYRIGCRRILRSNTYYQALQQDNVQMCFDDISSFHEKGIASSAEIFDLDAIVLATGFHLPRMYSEIEIVGKYGESLISTLTSKRFSAYLGTFLHGFPNFFTLNGLTTASGHHSAVYMIESQVLLLVRLFQEMKKKSIKSIDIKDSLHTEYEEKIGAVLDASIWASGCTSFYQNQFGRPVMWPYKTPQYRKQLKAIRLNRFDIEYADKA